MSAQLPAVAALAVVLFVPVPPTHPQARADDGAILQALWKGFVSTYVTPEGRVRRPEHGDDTVSEGQAYAMLRAVWMNDRAAFDRIWHWTRDHLGPAAGGEAGLLAWRWERDRIADAHFAPDADADYAFALVLASRRWGARGVAGRTDSYLDEATRVLGLLLDHSVATDRDGTQLFLPGSWADRRDEGRGLVLNPSYFAPAWFRVFHDVTGDARWLQLADSSYLVLRAICGPGSTRALPVVPDWIQWESAADWSVWDERPAVSSWDAVRVPWRIGTDRMWFGGTADPQDRRTAGPQDGVFSVDLSLSGEPLAHHDHPLANAMYWFALSDDTERDRLLARLRGQIVWKDDGTASFGESQYYVNSLAYLPFLAQSGQYGSRF